MRKVTNARSSLVAYENQSETMRARFEACRGANVPAARVATLVPAAAAIADLANPSLLPAYEKVAKYFSFTVYGLTADADGLTLKALVPAARPH